MLRLRHTHEWIKGFSCGRALSHDTANFAESHRLFNPVQTGGKASLRVAVYALAVSLLEREAFKVNPQHFVSTVLLFLLAIGVKAQTFAASGEQPDRPAASNQAPRSFVTVRYTSGTEVALPVLITENGILFQTKVNDWPDPLYFTIDSGAAATYFDTETAKRLGMVPSGEGNVPGSR